MSIYGLRTPDEGPVDPDLPEHLQAIHLSTWIELIYRMKIPPARKTVALAFATFANADGSRVRPGMDKVADMVGMDRRNLQPHVRALETLGMLAEKRHGGGRAGTPNEYRLTRPVAITKLNLWLDPNFDRVPEGAGFIPVEQQREMPASDESLIEDREYRMPASDETAELGMPASYEAFTEVTELGMPASDESPVDNSQDRETRDVSSRNAGCFMQKRGMPASTDQTKTRPDQQTLLGSPQVGTSPVAKITEKRQAIAMLVEDAEPDVWIPDVEPPAPRIVSGSAGLVPADGAHAAALAVLAALPGGARFFAGLAARQLANEGIPDPSHAAVAIRAAALARPDSESRSA